MITKDALIGLRQWMEVGENGIQWNCGLPSFISFSSSYEPLEAREQGVMVW